MIERKREQMSHINENMSKEERLEWLMNEYGRTVTRLAFNYMKQKQLAEDVAQEVFIKCYENLDGFRNESSYKTWVYRITVNLCKDKLKSWAYRNILVTEFFSKTKKTNSTPESELLDSEDRRLISEKILSLPVKYREIVILYYYEELSYNEISDLLQLNMPTVKSRLHRARHLLKNLLERSRDNE
ncbi:sigma-70 family RNA polymerase sigma factor [Bacillus sp. 31A1R]|uniref:Sigma-70 family RNA polymerase sigma factor n=1 Tax=Robertmurraya mangrovi TaxID=3098077 RepID=A0ABU5IW95_9BACI|nr:sigma-70 family RNA polymerase sigma factor [Bacillus sp. 31A1R]MDZ5471433.1 sigma-70 family RNA polymerase sigma factor [Bacillus sp. 31A1R]